MCQALTSLVVHTTVVFFFFFQAEDGIRDKLVTGVQTCALPISSPKLGPVARIPRPSASSRSCAAAGSTMRARTGSPSLNRWPSFWNSGCGCSARSEVPRQPQRWRSRKESRWRDASPRRCTSCTTRPSRPDAGTPWQTSCASCTRAWAPWRTADPSGRGGLSGCSAPAIGSAPRRHRNRSAASTVTSIPITRCSTESASICLTSTSTPRATRRSISVTAWATSRSRACARAATRPRWRTGKRRWKTASSNSLVSQRARPCGPTRYSRSHVTSISDTITGTVTGPDGQPLGGAIAQATSVTTQVTRRQGTDARGRFTILLPESGGPYELVVRYFGMVPARLSVVRQAHEDRLTASVRMDLAALPNPIVAILSARDSLRLSAAQAARLRGISDSLPAQNLAVSDSRILQALERARSVLTAYQWARLCDALRTLGSRQPASPLGSVQAALQPTAPAPQARNAQQALQQLTAPRPWSVYTGFSNVYDSNIDHSQLGPESYGVLAVLGGQYRQRLSGTAVELRYDGVFRRYTNTDIWNRPGHSASVSLAQRLARRWAVGAVGADA